MKLRACITLAAIALALVFIAAQQAAAVPIPVFNTGIGVGPAPAGPPLLTTGQSDIHWIIVGTGNPVVTDSTKAPLVAGPWLANSPESKWISLTADQSLGSPIRSYTYQQIVAVPALPDQALMRLASDDGYIVKLNGVQIAANPNSSYGAFSNWFNVPFVASLNNTIDVIVDNIYGPSGLRVEFQNAVPEPGSLTLLGTGAALLLLGFYRRRK